MLTEQQKIHFETFGFLNLQQVFPAGEMAEIIAAAEDYWQELLAAEPGAAAAVHPAPFIEKMPRLAQLAEDDRIFLPIRQLLKPGFIWGGSEGHKSLLQDAPPHQWHCDRVGEIDLHYIRIKIMIYLQPMQRETGALRVLPGSHRLPFHRRLEVLQPSKGGTASKGFGVDGAALPFFPLEVMPGDVVVFNHYLFHGVYGKQKRRRYIAMKFADAPETREHYEALRDHGQDASRLADEFRYSERPRIKGMVEKLLAWEEHLAAGG